MADLIKWRPFHSLMKDFFNDLDPFFDSPRSVLKTGLNFNPRMDIKDTEKDLSLIVDIPGMDKKDISIAVEDGVLAVKGERKGEKREEKDGYVHHERNFGSFERRLRLPENAEQDKIKADYKDGVLTVSVPKKELPKPKTKKIEVL